MSFIRGRRVLDLSTEVAGLYAGRLLGRYGFDVTRARLDDPAAVGSMVFDGAAAGDGPYRRWLDIGTNQAVIKDRAELADLVTQADIVLSTYTPAAIDELGLRRLLQPGTTLISVTPYGLVGPRAGAAATEQTLFAGAGAMLISGAPTRPPLAPALPIPSILGGTYAAMAAVLDRLRGRESGAVIDLSLHEVLAVNTERVFSWYSYLEAIPYRGVGSGRIEQASGGGFLRAADGYFYVFSGYQWFPKVAELVGRPDLVDAVGADPAARRAGAQRINEAIADAVATFTVAELTERAAPLRMPSGPVNTPLTLLRDAQLASRDMFSETELGDLDFAEPYRIHDGPAHSRLATAGARNDGGRSRPLAGMRVIDLTHAFAGPTTSRILGEAGADVIKIESPSHLDLLARGMAPFDNDTTGRWWDHSGYYGERNLGKRSITLDMSCEVGRELFLRLVDDADVLVSNFTPRVMRGWGLTSDVLHARNPGLVILLMSGFGSSGPRAHNPALAGTMESASGFSSLVRASDEEPPGALGFNFGDMVSGVSGAGSVLFALARRADTGHGQVIDFACAEAPIPFLAAQLLHAHATGTDPAPDRDFHAAGQHVLIETGGGTQQWVLAHLAAGTSRQTLLDTVESEPSGGDGVPRTSLDRAKVLELLEQAGVLATPVADAEDLWLDPALRDRGAFLTATRHGFPTLPYARALPGIWDGAQVGPAIAHIPSLGEDNSEVFADLDVAPEELLTLERDGVTGSRPRGKLPRTFTVPLALEELETLGLIRRVPGARDGLIESFAADRPR